MPSLEFRHRKQLATAIRSSRAAVAVEVTDQFLARHPDWQARYGEAAQRFGIEDAGYHQDFLAAAIESGEVQAFGDYVAWATRMLKARNIEPHFVAENIEQIARALRARLATSDADIVDSFVAPAVERCLRVAVDALPATERPGQLSELAKLYAQAAIGGNRQAALNLVLDAARHGAAVSDIYADVLQCALYRIGQLWEQNQISVAQEHMATAITQFVIAQLYPLIDAPQTSRGKIVITGVEGEFHQVGANMVADILEADGYDVRFLGTNTPLRGVLDAITEHQTDVVGISATMLFNMPHVTRLVEAIRERFGERMRIIVGGAAFRAAPKLCEEIGANACALDLRAAVQLVNQLAQAQRTSPHLSYYIPTGLIEIYEP